MKTNIKVIATSLSLATSVSAIAGMGGLSVQSHLGQPFSGSIVVSGDEARAVIASGSVNVSGGLRASVIKQSEDRVIVRLRSTSPVREPVITFTVSAGRQTREYTAFLDPIRYTPKEAPTDADIKANRREQNMRQNQQRTQQRDFIERKHTVAERNRAANVVPSDETRSQVANSKKNSKVAVSSRRHRAQAGESLANIAERYRPRNMSQQTAMRALMLANPSAFKHGTTIRRNVTLYIPTESQWHAYAQRAQKQVMKERVQKARQVRNTHVHVPTVADEVVAPVEPKPAVTQPETATPSKKADTSAANTTTAPKSAQVASEVKAVPASKPVEVKASETNKAGADKDKLNAASAVATKASGPVVQPNAPKAETASKSQAAASAVAGSAVVASSQVSAPAAPVAKPKPPVRPSVVETPVEEETDYMDYLPLVLGGVGGAAVLGVGAYALSRRRKKNGQADANDDGEWETEDNSVANKSDSSSIDDEWGGDIDFGAAATQTHAAAPVKSTVIDEEAYFGDEEFSLDKYESQTAFSSANNKANNEFSLDSQDEFSLDKFDSFDEVPPARKSPAAQDDEWSLHDTQPQTVSNQAGNEFVEADEDDWSLDKLDAITEFGKQQTPEQTFSLDDFVVDDIQPAAVEKAAEPAPVADVVQPAFDETAAFDFSDFETKETVATTVEVKANDDAEFNLDSFDDFAAPKVVETVEAEPVSEPVFDLNEFAISDKAKEVLVESTSDLGLGQFAATSVGQTEKAIEEDLSFGLVAFDDFSLPETSNNAAQSVNEMAAVTPVAEETVVSATPALGNDDLAFGLAAFDDFSLPDTATAATQSLDEMVMPAAEEVAIQTAPVLGNNDLPSDLATFDDFLLPDVNQAEQPVGEVLAPMVEETMVQAPTASDDDLAFGLAAFDDFTLPETEHAEKSSLVSDTVLETFDAFEETATQLTEATVVQSAPVSNDLGVNTFDDFVVPESTGLTETPTNDLNLNDFAAFETPTALVSHIQSETTLDDTLAASLEDFMVMPANEPVSSLATQFDEIAPATVKADENLAFGLDAFEDFQEPVVAVAKENQFDDLASLDTFVVDASAIQATSAQSAENMTDDVSLGLGEAFDAFAAPEQIAETTPVVADIAQSDDLAAAFNLADEIEAISPALGETPISLETPMVAEPAISLDAPIVEEPAISLNVPNTNDGFDDLVLDVDLDTAAPVGLSQPAAVGMMDLTTGPLESISSLDNVNLDTLEVIEDVQGWQQAENANVGFVSGSVNDMTEPLEAKFELAKMYLEIDDAVAARETLRELISESSGAIREQAKNLLADLGN